MDVQPTSRAPRRAEVARTTAVSSGELVLTTHCRHPSGSGADLQSQPCRIGLKRRRLKVGSSKGAFDPHLLGLLLVAVRRQVKILGSRGQLACVLHATASGAALSIAETLA